MTATLTLIAAALLLQCPDGTPPPCRAVSRPARAAPPSMSVAVLGF